MFNMLCHEVKSKNLEMLVARLFVMTTRDLLLSGYLVVKVSRDLVIAVSDIVSMLCWVV